MEFCCCGIHPYSMNVCSCNKSAFGVFLHLFAHKMCFFFLHSIRSNGLMYNCTCFSIHALYLSRTKCGRQTRLVFFLFFFFLDRSHCMHSNIYDQALTQIIHQTPAKQRERNGKKMTADQSSWAVNAPSRWSACVQHNMHTQEYNTCALCTQFYSIRIVAHIVLCSH